MPSQNYLSTLKIIPMSQAEAALLVKRLLGSYPSLNAHDPEVYIAELVTILTKYSLDIGETAVRQAKLESPTFVPTAPQLEVACEKAVEARYGSRVRISHWDRAAKEQLEELGQRTPNYIDPVPQQCRANVFVPPYAPQYAEMLEKTKTGDPAEWSYDPKRPGIWVALGWLKPSWAGLSGHAQTIVTAAQVKEKYDLSDQQWDEIPDQPSDNDYWRGRRAAT